MLLAQARQWNPRGVGAALTLKNRAIVLVGLCNAQSRPVARDVFGLARQSVLLAFGKCHVLFIGWTQLGLVTVAAARLTRQQVPLII